MPCKTQIEQKNSFSQLTVTSSAEAPTPPTNHQYFCRKVNNNSSNHSEFIRLAWNNMASIKSARELSRKTNEAAKDYYQLTFIEDVNEDEEEVFGGESSELNDSVHNSKFTFDDDEAWLGSRKKSEILDSVDDFSTAEINMFERTSARKDKIGDSKPSKIRSDKQTVIGLFVSQASNDS